MEVVTKYRSFDGESFDTEAKCVEHEVEYRKLQLEQWKFSYLLRTELREEYKNKTTTCADCNGTGLRQTVSFGYMDDGDNIGMPPVCGSCRGSGHRITYYTGKVTEHPEFPEELKNILAKAWNSYWENVQN